eukprot:SAG31_NODE_16969_length_688_cov_1.207131_2_plen_42_part_01
MSAADYEWTQFQFFGLSQSLVQIVDRQFSCSPGCARMPLRTR